MGILFNNTWIVFITVTVINCLIFKHRSKKHILENPALQEGYRKLFRGSLIFGNIPWIIMGIGNITGMTTSSFEFLSTKTMNPIVLVFHGAIIILWILSVWWIYFKDGAEMLENHPGLVQKSSFSGNSNMTAKEIKIFFPIGLAGGIIGMIIMWSQALGF